ncbi:MAG: 1-phosphofructokinase [Lachnospiraceae bacterium]|nr:1-phosphofructokinase [Lachnospiraceae bacterium]
MILTISLNPAIDKTAICERLMPGQLNRLSGIQICPGGKGINVSRALNCLGEKVCAMGFIGGGNGEYIKKELEKSGIRTAFTNTGRGTRINLNVISEDGFVTEILEPGPAPDVLCIEDFLGKYKKELKKTSLVVISGSLPEGMDNGFYAKLITMAAEEKKRVILDSSGEPERCGVEAIPYMIKPNLREFEYILGRHFYEPEDIARAAGELVRRGIERVAVSLGSRGMVYVTPEVSLYAQAPRLNAINTVSCGDAAVAGFAYSLVRNLKDEEALIKAVAVSAAAALSQESGLFLPDDESRFAGRITVSECT